MSRKRSNNDEVKRASKRRIVEIDKENEDLVNLNQSQCFDLTDSNNSIFPTLKRSGKILKIHLKNFMCHSNFIVDFNKRSNLLVGSNGSGKSAVLTALIIGLGCKASTTSRSSNIKQLIRHGQSSATVEIHLSNDGTCAYESNKYGDRIIIVRHIVSSGSSSYKIKNSDGTVISTGRKDVMKILLYLNIQVDNPVCILNQDAARTFLRDSDPKKRYKLFMKATYLDKILEDLKECEKIYGNCKAHNQELKEIIEKEENQLKQLEEKYLNLLSVENLGEEIKKLQIELAWSKYYEQSELFEKIQQSLNENVVNLANLEEAVSNRSKREEELNKKISEFRDALKKNQTVLVTLQSDYNDKRSVYIQQKDKIANQNKLYKKQEEKKRRIEEDIIKIENDLATRNNDFESQITLLRDEHKKKLEILQKEKDDIDAMIASIRRDIEMIQNTLSHYEESMSETDRKINEAERENRKLTEQLRQLEGSAKDNLAIYGQYMPKLLRAIESQHKKNAFSQKPKGPFGSFIEVPNQKWRALIENILGVFVFAFVVNSEQDRKKLNHIIKTEIPEASHINIISCKFRNKVYDVRNGRCDPPEHSTLLMNEINVTDPDVMNVLIDYVHIETILLVEDINMAIHYTQNRNNVPINLSKLILLEPFSEYYPQPTYRMYSKESKPARFIQVDTTQLKRHLIERIAQLKEKLAELSKDKKSLQEQIRQQNKTLKDKNDKRVQIGRKKIEIDEQISDINAYEYPAQNEYEVLQHELEELQNFLETVKIEEEKEKNIFEKLKQVLNDKEEEINSCKNKVKKYLNDKQEMEKMVDNFQSELQEMIASLRMTQIDLETKKAYVQNLEKQCTIEEKAAQTLLKKAQATGEQTENNNSEEELKQMIKNRTNKIQLIRNSNHSIDNVKEVFEKAKEKKENNEKIFIGEKLTLKSLKEARYKRYRYIARLKKHMTILIRHKFQAALTLRGYTGEIEIDEEQQLLELTVIPRDNHITNAVSSTKSLSGGERSFSTVAFLLALWQCVDHPFYALDEYDVFTDQVNRQYMTTLLLNEAEKKPACQFIFLTPQDMSNIQASNIVTIHRMLEPERN